MRQLVAPAVCLLLFCSCAKNDPNRKETYPVIGVVYVDGQPAGNLAVYCTDVKGLDKEHPTLSSAFTDDEGKFEISTYESADGIPEGEYILTFMWGRMSSISGYGGPDKLKGRYTDPKKSEYKVTVEAGKPTDLGQIDLTTK